jgi:xylan 1,4-beta-xylosidase
MNILIRQDLPTKKLNKHWEYCIGSGHAKLALRTDYVEQLKKVHDELGIRYVRFHGIFNDDLNILMNMGDLNPIPGAERFKQLSFRYVGLIYDNILKCGMKPYVELSFMPKHLAADSKKQTALYYGGYISAPKSDEEWTTFIQQFVQYLILRYGKDEVETWPFEVWNEPDIFVFWGEDKAAYYHLYEITVRAIKAVDENIQVGGPATSGCKWIGSFTDYCKKRRLPVDFISTHVYAGDPIGGVSQTEGLEDENRNDFVIPTDMMTQLFDSMPKEYDVLDALRGYMPDKSELEEIDSDTMMKKLKIVRQQAQEFPIYISEWNENAIFGSKTNDTRKVAAYLVKAALEVEDLVTASSVWAFSDIFEEFSNFPQEFHGGFGLLTNNGIEKPQYHAMQMLHEAAENRIDLGAEAVCGEITAAAFRDEERTQVLLFRQNMKNLSLPKETVTVQIELGEAPSGVSLKRIDDEHGNPLQKWEDMGSPVDLLPRQIQKLKEYSKLGTEFPEFTYENNLLTVQVELGVNDVYFITARK